VLSFLFDKRNVLMDKRNVLMDKRDVLMNKRNVLMNKRDVLMNKRNVSMYVFLASIMTIPWPWPWLWPWRPPADLTHLHRLLRTAESRARMVHIHDTSAFVGSALWCWVKEGWDWLFMLLQDALLK
jgi:hypothetical protein